MTAEPKQSSVTGADDEGPLQPGTRFGKFDIKQRIGRGGYASVYHAFDNILRREVAIKVLHRVGGVSQDMLRRGVVEAQLMCQLQHPNIVKVYDANITESGLLYLVMELLVGQTLWQVLRRYERLAVEEACSIAAQIADAVEVAHQHGAIHRDLKPENVFVTAGNSIKVLDFGIAKVVHEAQGQTTRPDAIQGTVLYMSPEQIAGNKITPRSDIFALGNIMFEMLYGKNPCLLQDPHADTMRIAWMQTYEVPPSLESIAPYCPQHLSRIVAQAMAKRADGRQASMRELRDILEASRARFVADTGGELKGRVRDLAGVMEAKTDNSFAPLSAGKFSWSEPAPPIVPERPPSDRSGERAANEPRMSSSADIPVGLAGAAAVATSTKTEQGSVPFEPSDQAEVAAQVAPTRDPTPIALQVRQLPKSVVGARRRRIPLPVVISLWAAATLGGFGASVGVMKIYAPHRRTVLPAEVSSDAPEKRASTIVPLPAATPPSRAPVEAQVEATSPITRAEIAPPVSSLPLVPASSPRPKTTARPAAKSKPLDPSEARLRALEEQLNSGKLRARPNP